MGCVVIPIAPEILDAHAGVGYTVPDQPLDLGRIHRHRVVLFPQPPAM